MKAGLLLLWSRVVAVRQDLFSGSWSKEGLDRQTEDYARRYLLPHTEVWEGEQNINMNIYISVSYPIMNNIVFKRQIAVELDH